MSLGSGRLAHALGFLAFVVLSTGGANLPAQSNILANGSFEAVFDYWALVGGADVNIGNWSAAHGTNWLVPYTAIYQDVNTVPGRGYVVKFASGNHNAVGVRWGNSAAVNISLTNATASATLWLFTNAVFTATSSPTRLRFESISGPFKLDAVEVGWLEEPPTVLTPVASRSTFEGGGVSFVVGASGGPPLEYQWYFDGQALSGATNRMLLLTNVTLASAGKYRVHFTNAFGAASSSDADLVVNSLPRSPLVIRQPRSQSIPEGYAAGFYVVAFGSAPLAYQWQFNGTNIANATNASYDIAAAYPTNSGEYAVTISNNFGTVASLPAMLTVTNGATGIVHVDVANRFTLILDSPIFDVDGTTKLAGSNYWVQLYAGFDPNRLRPVRGKSNFRSGAQAGYFYFLPAVLVPGIPIGELVLLQIRVWDSTYGKSFEEAQARGGRFGKSNIYTLAGHDPAIPILPQLLPLLRFALEAGVSPLATAKIEVDEGSPPGPLGWVLIGDPGFVYVVEQRSPPNDWTPLLTVTNETGSVKFADPNAQNTSAKFYRARILEL